MTQQPPVVPERVYIQPRRAETLSEQLLDGGIWRYEGGPDSIPYARVHPVDEGRVGNEGTLGVIDGFIKAITTEATRQESLGNHHGSCALTDQLALLRTLRSDVRALPQLSSSEQVHQLTLPELRHLSALLEAERESGEYAGPREQYYARTERLIKWCQEQING